MAVKLGLKGAKRYHLFLVGGAMILSLLFGLLYYRSISSLLFIIAYIPLIKHLKTVFNAKEAKDLDPQLKVLALTTFVLSVLLSLGHIYNAM
jgi:1,4-dihydroxy-2-naphthoate octaprenyltransferase